MFFEMFHTSVENLLDAVHLASQNVLHVIDMSIIFREPLIHAPREVVEPLIDIVQSLIVDQDAD